MPASTAFVFAGSGSAGSCTSAGQQSLWATSTRIVRPDPPLLRIRHDTTLSLKTTEQILHVLHVARAFGALSGLHDQPAKGQRIVLNRSVKLERYAGIAVVSTCNTTRYLGSTSGAASPHTLARTGAKSKSWANGSLHPQINKAN